ncbi:MAG: hypothetical protein ACSLFR_13855 [Solirubrobacteraceae bacterium]
MPRLKLLSAAVAMAAVAISTSPASADTLVAAAPGAKNLAAGGGWLAWAAPVANGRWRLTLRNPANGVVSVPAIPDFGSPPDPAIGSDVVGTDLSRRRLVVAYSRCSGTSSISGCDVWAYDIVAGTEARIGALGSSTYSETTPSVSLGTWSFVRRGGGTRTGVTVYTRRSRATRRLSSTLARETSVTGSGSRVAYVYNSSRGGGVALRRASGDGGLVTLTSRRDDIPHSLVTTRYRAAWLEGTTAWQTTRFGSGDPDDIDLIAQTRALPDTTDSIAADGSAVFRYLDARGVVSVSPRLFGTS